MRARSTVNWLSHPKFKATRAAVAAGSLAGLAVLGACSEGLVTSKVAGPTISDPRFGVVGANHHKIIVCVDPFSSAGSYSFATAINNSESNPLELPTSSDPDLSGFGIIQNSLGPFNPGDAIVTPVLLTPGNCADVFIRNETVNNANNRMWQFPGQGTVNPYATMNVTATIPAGFTYSVQCTNDDPNLPQTAGCSAGPIVVNPVFTSANIFHGTTVTYTFTAPANPTVFLVLDEDAIDNEDKPRFFTKDDVNDGISKLGQRKELKWFDEHPGTQTVIWSGRMGDEGWFAPTFIPPSWAAADGDADATDGLRNYVGLPVAPGLGTGSDPEKLLDKIPNVYPLRAEGLWLLMGRTVCAVVYDSHVGINYEFKGTTNTLGAMKGETLGIVAFTVDNVQWLQGESSSQLPKVTITVRDADTVCAGPLNLLTNAPIPQSSSTVVDLKPNAPG